MREDVRMQEVNSVRAEEVHHTYEQQVAAVNAQMRDQLWGRVAALARAIGGGDGLRVEHDDRTLTMTDAATGRTLRLAMDEVLDLPDRERPGPFGMGNARVIVTAWEGTERTWLLRHTTTGTLEYRWVTMPGDVLVDDDILAALVQGLRRGELPPDPAETAHLDVDSPSAGVASLATGTRWAIVNLYSGERHGPDQIFSSGDEAFEALKDLVRGGRLQEGDWEVRPVS